MRAVMCAAVGPDDVHHTGHPSAPSTLSTNSLTPDSGRVSSNDLLEQGVCVAQVGGGERLLPPEKPMLEAANAAAAGTPPAAGQLAHQRPAQTMRERPEGAPGPQNTGKVGSSRTAAAVAATKPRGDAGHAGSVARRSPPITRPGEKAFADRCANARPGAIGVVSGRDSRDRRSTIPISPRIGSPEEGEMSLRTGPQASQTSPPPPPPTAATGPAAGRGPPRETISAKDTGQSHAIEPPETEAALLARHPYLAKMPASIRAIWLARLQ